MLISTLLPANVKEFLRQREQEVNRLCGPRYRHQKDRDNYRWSSGEGSIVLANQRIALEVPRVRGKGGKEVRLETYEQFQDPDLFDRAVFTEGIKRVSQGDYEKGVSRLANSFGFKKSAISKRWIKAEA